MIYDFPRASDPRALFFYKIRIFLVFFGSTQQISDILLVERCRCAKTKNIDRREVLYYEEQQ